MADMRNLLSKLTLVQSFFTKKVEQWTIIMKNHDLLCATISKFIISVDRFPYSLLNSIFSQLPIHSQETSEFKKKTAAKNCCNEAN